MIGPFNEIELTIAQIDIEKHRSLIRECLLVFCFGGSAKVQQCEFSYLMAIHFSVVTVKTQC